MREWKSTLTLRMYHGCVYTGSFELDYPHTLLAALHVHRIEIPYRAFPNGLVQEFYRLKVLIILEQLITSVVKKKKNNLNEQNFKVYRKIRIEDRGSRNQGPRIG